MLLFDITFYLISYPESIIPSMIALDDYIAPTVYIVVSEHRPKSSFFEYRQTQAQHGKHLLHAGEFPESCEILSDGSGSGETSCWASLPVLITA